MPVTLPHAGCAAASSARSLRGWPRSSIPSLQITTTGRTGMRPSMAHFTAQSNFTSSVAVFPCAQWHSCTCATLIGHQANLLTWFTLLRSFGLAKVRDHMARKVRGQHLLESRFQLCLWSCGMRLLQMAVSFCGLAYHIIERHDLHIEQHFICAPLENTRQFLILIKFLISLSGSAHF